MTVGFSCVLEALHLLPLTHQSQQPRGRDLRGDLSCPSWEWSAVEVNVCAYFFVCLQAHGEGAHRAPDQNASPRDHDADGPRECHLQTGTKNV